MGEAGGHPRRKLEKDKASLRAQWVVVGEAVQTAKDRWAAEARQKVKYSMSQCEKGRKE